MSILNLVKLPFSLIIYLIQWLFFLVFLPFRLVANIFRDHAHAVQLRIQGPVHFGKAHGIQGLINSSHQSVEEIKEALEAATTSLEVKKVVLDVSGSSLTTSEIHTLKSVISESKKGIDVVLLLGENKLGVLALEEVADCVAMNPTSNVYAIPPAFPSMYYNQLLKKLGVSAQGIHIGDYKTAYNRFSRTKSSDAEKLAMENLSEGFSRYIEQILQGRLLKGTSIRDTLYRRGVVDARTAQLYGLVDRLVYPHEMSSFCKDPETYDIAFDLPPDQYGLKSAKLSQSTQLVKAGTSVESDDERDSLLEEIEPLEPTVFIEPKDLPDIFEWKKKRISIPRFTGMRPAAKRIGILNLEGMIMPDEVPGGPPMGEGQAITPGIVQDRLRRLQERNVDGILLVVNSPGGSATASEEIWYTLRKASGVIPMVSYCMDVAASGGYYLAVSAPYIYCDPTSIVGSIGVVTAQISLKTVLERLKIYHETHGEDVSSPFNMYRAIDAESTELMAQGSRAFYRNFLDRVGQSRHIPKRMLHRAARGRVYLGEQALYRYLVDGTGGYQEAMKQLTAMADAKGRRIQVIEENNTVVSLKSVLQSQLTLPSVKRLERLVEGFISGVPTISDSRRGHSELSEMAAVAELLQRGELLAYETTRLNS